MAPACASVGASTWGVSVSRPTSSGAMLSARRCCPTASRIGGRQLDEEGDREQDPGVPAQDPGSDLEQAGDGHRPES